ncbi:MAG: hypothetical protein V7642_2129 [Burkholderiales bacterium]
MLLGTNVSHKVPMEEQPDVGKPKLLRVFLKHYSGTITQVALSALSAWLIIIGVKGLAGFTVNAQTALADLLGILIVIGVLRWVKLKYKVK